jgi:hypothetical protein
VQHIAGGTLRPRLCENAWPARLPVDFSRSTRSYANSEPSGLCEPPKNLLTSRSAPAARSFHTASTRSCRSLVKGTRLGSREPGPVSAGPQRGHRRRKPRDDLPATQPTANPGSDPMRDRPRKSGVRSSKVASGCRRG